jgi:hypothetical protein
LSRGSITGRGDNYLDTRRRVPSKIILQPLSNPKNYARLFIRRLLCLLNLSRFAKTTTCDKRLTRDATASSIQGAVRADCQSGGEHFMIYNKKLFVPLIFSLLFVLLMSGCAGTVKHMQVVAVDKVVSSPEEGKAMIVFMRPSTLGFAIQSSVFEITNNPSLVGIVAAKKKVSYQLEPGEHLFMVVGESADFMSAELEANKTYYALVTPRMGMWKARFSLKPIPLEELNTPQFKEWLQDCEWVEKSPSSDVWASENMSDIRSKQGEYYVKWMNKEESDRPKLLPKDGK